MPILITPSLFVGDISITNKSNADVNESIVYFINKYEPDCLKRIFGDALYASYNTDASTPRMLSLLNGKTYTADDATEVVWEGVNSTVNNMIANFVYYHYQKNDATKNSGIGVIIKKSEMAYNVSPADKMLSAYNQFARKVKNMVRFLTANSEKDNYAEFTPTIASRVLYYNRPINEFL